MLSDSPANLLLKHPRILAHTLHIADKVYHNMLITAKPDRIEVTPFYRETPSTVYLDRPVRLIFHTEGSAFSNLTESLTSNTDGSITTDSADRISLVYV